MNDFSRRLPDLAKDTPDEGDPTLVHELMRRFAGRVHVDVGVAVRTGVDAAVVIVVVGDADSAWELFAFARGPGDPRSLEGALGAAVDVADALVLAQAAGDRPPLDWHGAPLRRCATFIRGERRAYVAEAAAAALLDEEPMPRAIPGWPRG
jgi:hypothetical protein